MSSYVALTDLELAALLKEGDHLAFGELYDRYNRLLYVHAYRVLGDEEEARDLVQDLFTWLWDNRSEFQVASNFSGLLYVSIRNKALKRIAQRKVGERYLQSVGEFFAKGEAKTDHLLRSKELERLIEAEIERLPDYLRETFRLRRQGLSHREIADVLEVSEKTTRNQLSKALKILRMRLGLLAYIYLIFHDKVS